MMIHPNIAGYIEISHGQDCSAKHRAVDIRNKAKNEKRLERHYAWCNACDDRKE
jgi:hypothetical protein